MKRQLTKAKKDGYRIIYIDETMFTRATVPKSEYCLPKQNVSVDVAKLGEPKIALLAGVSKEKRLEHFRLFDRSSTFRNSRST